MTRTRRSLLYGVLLLLMLWAAFPGRWAWNEHRLAKAEEEEKAALARKARALYEEKCRTVAGEKIYRTVPDVDGIVLLKVRPEAGGREWADLMWPGAAFALESRAGEYITTFLGYEQSSREGVPVTPDRRGYINTNYVPENASNLPGYRYVDVIDEKDGQRYRYTGSNKVVGKKDITAPNVQLGIKNDPTYDLNVYQWTLVKSLAPDPSPRYGVTFEDHVIPDERALGVASSTVRVLDIKTGEVLGEMTRFAWGSTKPSGFNPTPWLTAWKCPAHGVGANAATRKFVDQVLVPRSNH